jgi:hypothetical protein
MGKNQPNSLLEIRFGNGIGFADLESKVDFEGPVEPLFLTNPDKSKRLSAAWYGGRGGF